MFKCIICAVEKPDDELHQSYINICKSCATASKSRKALIRQRNDNWMKIAQENDIPLYDRQPAETDTEWKIWQAYSGMYPEKKPSAREVALTTGMSLSHVQHTMSRWDYNVRMQHYKAFVDALTKQERVNSIKEMNAKHVSMAQKLQAKLDRAIDCIQPEYLKPTDLNALLKTMAELERKAHLDTTAEESTVDIAGNGQSAKVTKKEDMGEILAILGAAGMLEGKQVGIERTERVIVKDE